MARKRLKWREGAVLEHFPKFRSKWLKNTLEADFWGPSENSQKKFQQSFQLFFGKKSKEICSLNRPESRLKFSERGQKFARGEGGIEDFEMKGGSVENLKRKHPSIHSGPKEPHRVI